jgi:hypothetical protein
MLKPAVLVPLVLSVSMFVWGPVAGGAQPPMVARTAASDSDWKSAPWAIDMQRRHAQLIERNGPGTDAALRATLLAMGDKDQDARGIVHGQPKNSGKLEMARNLAEIDAGLTARLKEIVAKEGWPTIALVGIDASNAAMTILTHTRDHAWQLALLPQLEELADTGKIDGSALALVVDKELVSEGRLQRYGTQFKYVDGAMAMFGVEDAAGLDVRRATLFLPPMDAYKQLLMQMYHLPVSNTIVSSK